MPSRIIELAPFLFFWAAEESLRQRRTRIYEKERDSKAATLDIPYLLEPDTSEHEKAFAAEKESIDRRDLFGRYMIFYTDWLEKFAFGFDTEEENPFAIFLRELADSLDGLAEFEAWDGERVPSYRVCFDESAALVGGDADRAEEILDGLVALHEMPKEISQPEKTKERATWVHERAQESREELKRWLKTLRT